MLPRNPSEIARLYDELEYCKQETRDLRRSKSYREDLLREQRRLEELLGVESEPYNVSTD